MACGKVFIEERLAILNRVLEDYAMAYSALPSDDPMRGDLWVIQVAIMNQLREDRAALLLVERYENHEHKEINNGEVNTGDISG